jgi:hypothetical protein
VFVPIMKAGQKAGDFLEQAPFLEWKNSTFSPGAPCGTCHMPTKNDAMVDISSPIAKWPEGLAARKPFGKHRFMGGNAYMLRMISENLAFTGSDIAPSELLDAADAAEEHLSSGVILSIASAAMEGDALAADVLLENHAGHKFPTGYPGRRVWIHVRAEGASGEVIFESGGFDAEGSLVDRSGKRLDDIAQVMPHRDVIQAENEVQVYEAVGKTEKGSPTHLPLESVGYAKDNRILPIGWSSADPLINWIQSVGVSGDATFGAGSDRVTYRIPKGSSVKHLAVRLLYQTVRPVELQAIAKVPHPASVRFSQMAKNRAPVPTVIAEATRDF